MSHLLRINENVNLGRKVARSTSERADKHTGIIEKSFSIFRENFD